MGTGSRQENASNGILSFLQRDWPPDPTCVSRQGKRHAAKSRRRTSRSRADPRHCRLQRACCGGTGHPASPCAKGCFGSYRSAELRPMDRRMRQLHARRQGRGPGLLQHRFCLPAQGDPLPLRAIGADWQAPYGFAAQCRSAKATQANTPHRALFLCCSAKRHRNIAAICFSSERPQDRNGRRF